MANHINVATKKKQDEDIINLRKIFEKLTDRWPLFLMSVIVALLIAYVYIISTPAVYRITAKVLVKSENNGDVPAIQNSAENGIGELLSVKSSVDNEVQVLKTRTLMEQVVREMQLNVLVSQKEGLRTIEVYEPPFSFKLLQQLDAKVGKTLTLYKEKDVIYLEDGDVKQKIAWNKPFHVMGLGSIIIQPKGNQIFRNKESYILNVTPFDRKVASLLAQLSVALNNKQVTIIDLSLNYPVKEKGEDILNYLIKRYRDSNLEERNAVAESTINFIQGRLSYLGGELGDLEGNIQQFRESNRLVDLSEQGKLLIENTGQYNNELARTETQITILNEIERHLKEEKSRRRILPSALLPNDQVYTSMMERYNSILLERDRQLLSVTEQSPFIQNIDEQLENLRRQIISNIATTKASYTLTRRNLQQQIRGAEGTIQGVPKMEKNYLVLARQQKIKEQLYIFLMEKAEEMAISKTSTVAIAKTIESPKADFDPISPRIAVVLLTAFSIGIFLPILYILIRELTNTTVNAKDEIRKLTSVPILGEISHSTDYNNLIVAHKGRSAIAEQFRALRTNLSFYLKDTAHKVILFTSSISGEGKSFTAINLANIYAVTGKKVLLIELDLRKPGISNKLNMSNKVGFTSYIINPRLDLSAIVQPTSINENLFLLSSGPLPPNPAEMLMSENAETLLQTLKQQYDYLIIDAPPIGIITDAQLLAHYADVTLYLVRHKVSKKQHLEILEELYEQQKMNNLGLVVNDISSKNYGYGYDYGYGYSADELNDSVINKIKKVFKVKKRKR